VKKSKPRLAQTDPRDALRHVRLSHRSLLTYLLPALKATNSIKPTTLQVEDFIKTKKWILSPNTSEIRHYCDDNDELTMTINVSCLRLGIQQSTI